MVENRPEHRQAAEPTEPREYPDNELRDDMPDAATASAQDSAPHAIAPDEDTDAEPARGPEQAFDIAADQREQAEHDSGLPEPGFATTTAGADEAAARHSEPRRAGIASIILPPVLTIAIATGLVVGAAKMGLLPQFLSSTGVSAPQGDLAALDTLNARIAKLEARPAAVPGAPADGAAMDALAARIASLEARPTPAGATSDSGAAPDPALAGRIEALEKSVAALRDDLAALRAKADQFAATAKEPKPADGDAVAAARPAAAASPDATAALAAIDQRLGELERAAKAPSEKPEPAAAPVDTGLRRVVAASLLDITVQQGKPYAPLLKAATPLAADPAELKPLDRFATTGVPSAHALGEELILLLPKILPDKAGANANFIDRFQANAERLVKIQRSDAVEGIDRTAIIGRLTADARQGDTAAALKELKALAPADRAPVQSWIEKAEARDQALAASQHFATAALAALQKPSP
jgi:hypothetical protein